MQLLACMHWLRKLSRKSNCNLIITAFSTYIIKLLAHKYLYIRSIYICPDSWNMFDIYLANQLKYVRYISGQPAEICSIYIWPTSWNMFDIYLAKQLEYVRYISGQPAGICSIYILPTSWNMFDIYLANQLKYVRYISGQTSGICSIYIWPNSRMTMSFTSNEARVNSRSNYWLWIII